MQKRIAVILCFWAFWFAEFAQGQGTLYLSNLGESSSAAASIGSDAWVAQAFGTGANLVPNRDLGFSVDAVDVFMNEPIADPEGLSLTIELSGGGRERIGPGYVVGNLNGPAPVSDGAYRFTTSERITLGSLHTYWLVMTSEKPTGIGAYSWRIADSGNFTAGAESWYIVQGRHTSVDGLNWRVSGDTPMQFALYATAVPEPSTIGLLFLGGALLAALRLQRYRR